MTHPRPVLTLMATIALLGPGCPGADGAPDDDDDACDDDSGGDDDDATGDDDVTGDDDSGADDDSAGDDDTTGDDDSTGDDPGTTDYFVMSSWRFPVTGIVADAIEVGTIGSYQVDGGTGDASAGWLMSWYDGDGDVVCGWEQGGEMVSVAPTHPLATAEWRGLVTLLVDTCPSDEEGDAWDTRLAEVPYAAAFADLGPTIGKDAVELQDAADYGELLMDFHGMPVDQTGLVAYMTTGDVPFLPLGFVYEILEEDP